ncbi:MAG: branched-chain amino acid transport system substrate-binding protein [Patescibacteria group bacterium]|nr:branched-chain amino acid transport system substrate-binding protein [Patescibacteria group bacterium]
MWVVVVVLVLWGGYALLKKDSTDSTQPIRIGVVGPFAGPSAAFGEFINRGIELAMADLPVEIRNRIVLVKEDDKCTGPDAISAVNKLIQLEKVKYMIGPLCTTAVVATEKLYEDNGVITLTAGVPSEQIANMGENHFTFSPEIKYMMEALSGYVRQNNFSRIGIIYVKDAFGEENYNKFKGNFESNGGTVVAAEGVEKGSMDLRTQILKVKAANPDSIFIALTGGSIVAALKEIETQGLGNVPKFAIHGFQTVDVLNGAKNEAEGVIYPYPSSNVSTKKIEDYAVKYFNKYAQPVELYSSNVYDSFNVLVNAIVKCGYDDNKCVQKNIKDTKNYDGVNGTVSLDTRGVATFQQILLKTVKDGKFQNLK